jgi:hypothetical protein
MAPREEGFLIEGGFLIVVVVRSGSEVGIVHISDTTMCRMCFRRANALFRLSFLP